tara:strand:- start:82 stop:324 length:243 start_codon:yes stop_codon:yes gene_type:complete
MADPGYMGFKGINSDTTIKGDLVVTGSISSTGAIKEAGVALATLDAIQNMVIYDDTLDSLFNFDYVGTAGGDIVVHKIGS